MDAVTAERAYLHLLAESKGHKPGMARGLEISASHPAPAPVTYVFQKGLTS